MAVSMLAALTPEEAQARGHDVFDVTLIDWGRDTKDAFPIPTAGGVPNFPFTPQGVMIGPRSTVDRCWASWNIQRQIIGTPSFFGRELSVDTPMFFSMPAAASTRGTLSTAPANIFNDAQVKNLLFFYPQLTPPVIPFNDTPPGIFSTVTPATYKKADGTVVNFGPDNVFRPVLELRFLLKAGLQIPSTKRFPYQNWINFDVLAFPGEVAVGFWPVHGRKKILIQAAATKAGSIFRLGALRAINPVVALQETTEGQKTLTANNQSERFELCEPCIDWLVTYCTPADANTGCTITVTAYD